DEGHPAQTPTHMKLTDYGGRDIESRALDIAIVVVSPRLHDWLCGPKLSRYPVNHKVGLDWLEKVWMLVGHQILSEQQGGKLAVCVERRKLLCLLVPYLLPSDCAISNLKLCDDQDEQSHRH